jgi:hypothetical protein
MVATKKELLLAALVLVGILVVCEASLRLSRYSIEPQLYAPDVQLGWKLRAGATGVVTAENRQFVRINSHGFRDVERTYDKAENTVRIAVLGNSWTEALQVPQEKTYTAVLEGKLTRSACFAGKRVEVLNFGVAGYSTGQELMTLQQEVWKFHPDFVLLALYPARDIANNVRELNNAVSPEQSPYFVFAGNKLVLDDSFRRLPALQPHEIAFQNLRYRINQHVRVLQATGALQHWGKVRVAMAALQQKAENVGVDNLEYTIYGPPRDPLMQKAWHVTEALLLATRDEVRAHGAQFRVVVLPTRPQIILDQTKRQTLLQKLGVTDFTYADNRIAELGAREDFIEIELSPALAAYASANNIYLNGFNRSNIGAGHWNETGHRVAAEAIAEQLCAVGENSTAIEKITAKPVEKTTGGHSR